MTATQALFEISFISATIIPYINSYALRKTIYIWAFIGISIKKILLSLAMF